MFVGKEVDGLAFASGFAKRGRNWDERVDFRQECYRRVEWVMHRNFVFDYEITQYCTFQTDW